MSTLAFIGILLLTWVLIRRVLPMLIVRQVGRFALKKVGESAIAKVPEQKLLLPQPTGSSLGAYSAYFTLAFGSALALFLYPHSMTGILSSADGNVIQRNAALLPAYSLLLGLLMGRR